MPRVSGIHHVNIPIRDRATTLEWYQRVLGADLKEHPRQLEMLIGSAEVHCHENPAPVFLQRNHYAVEIPDWQGMIAHLASLDVPYDGGRGPAVRDYDGHHYAYIRDPDDNLIELIHHPMQ